MTSSGNRTGAAGVAASTACLSASVKSGGGSIIAGWIMATGMCGASSLRKGQGHRREAPLGDQIGKIVLVGRSVAQSPMFTIFPLIPSIARLVEHRPCRGGDRRVIRGGEIGGDHLIEIASGERGQRSPSINARHVHQRVEAAESIDHLLDGIVRLDRAGTGRRATANRVDAHASTRLIVPLDRRAARVIRHRDVRARGPRARGPGRRRRVGRR